MGCVCRSSSSTVCHLADAGWLGSAWGGDMVQRSRQIRLLLFALGIIASDLGMAVAGDGPRGVQLPCASTRSGGPGILTVWLRGPAHFPTAGTAGTMLVAVRRCLAVRPIASMAKTGEVTRARSAWIMRRGIPKLACTGFTVATTRVARGSTSRTGRTIRSQSTNANSFEFSSTRPIEARACRWGEVGVVVGGLATGSA